MKNTKRNTGIKYRLATVATPRGEVVDAVYVGDAPNERTIVATAKTGEGRVLLLLLRRTAKAIFGD